MTTMPAIATRTARSAPGGMGSATSAISALPPITACTAGMARTGLAENTKPVSPETGQLFDADIGDHGQPAILPVRAVTTVCAVLPVSRGIVQRVGRGEGPENAGFRFRLPRVASVKAVRALAAVLGLLVPQQAESRMVRAADGHLELGTAQRPRSARGFGDEVPDIADTDIAAHLKAGTGLDNQSAHVEDDV